MPVTFIQNAPVKAWGVTNVSGVLMAGNNVSVTPLSLGLNVTFIKPMMDVNYSVTATPEFSGGPNGLGILTLLAGSKTINGFTLVCYMTNGQRIEPSSWNFQVIA